MPLVPATKVSGVWYHYLDSRAHPEGREHAYGLQVVCGGIWNWQHVSEFDSMSYGGTCGTSMRPYLEIGCRVNAELKNLRKAVGVSNNSLNVMDVTNYILTIFQAHFTRWNSYLALLLGTKPFGQTTTDSNKETIALTLLKRHSIKLTPNDLLYPQIHASLKPCQRSFLFAVDGG